MLFFLLLHNSDISYWIKYFDKIKYYSDRPYLVFFSLKPETHIFFFGLIIPFFFLSNFSASMRAKVFKFCIHLERGHIYGGKENQDAEINFCRLFPFFLFSISQSNVIHREICAKNFSGTNEPRILKFVTNVGYDLLYCVRENQPPAAEPFPLFVHFSFSQVTFSVTDFSATMYESQSLQISYTPWEGQSMSWDRKPRCWDFFLPSLSIYPFFHLSLQCNT